MKIKIEIPYLAIGLTIDPTFLRGLQSETLLRTGVIPSDWAVSEEEIGPHLMSSFSFENGVTFVARDQDLRFAQALRGTPLKDSFIPQVVRAYVRSMPELEIRSVKIQIMGHFKTEPSEQNRARFLVDSLKGSPWSSLGHLKDAELDLTYDFGDCACELTVKRMIFSEDVNTPVVTFFAEFEHSIEANTTEDRLSLVTSIIDNWPTDIGRYDQMVDSWLSSMGVI